MKTYTVYFSEPITIKYLGDRFNHETKKWEEVEMERTDTSFNFTSLSPAKKLIKENIDKYAGSSITKIFSNGDFENLGEINLKGNNKTFVANTRQKHANY